MRHAGLCSAVLAMLGVLFLGHDRAGAADPVKIRLSYIVPIANWAPMLVEKKDLTKNLGKSYQLEITRFAGTPPLITALAAGEVDIADLTYPTFPIAVQNAGMSDLRVIADEFQDGNPAISATSSWCSPTARSKRSRTSKAR
jgi:ABC-type nitrate/sulfonate/bicarbonate transport system substrate-binding protein